MSVAFKSGRGAFLPADVSSVRECCEPVLVAERPFDLIETMRFDPMEGLIALDRHVARMKASAAALGFAFDRHDARNELHAATFHLTRASRVRMRLSRSGAIAIEANASPAAPAAPLAVVVLPVPVDTRDVRLNHKTSDRAFYDDARRAAGTDEVLFITPDGRLTEGSSTNLFVRRADGRLATPPLGGVMPGVLRAQLIDAGEAHEAPLTIVDLCDGFLLGNALRGLMPARLASKVAARGLAR